MTSMTLVQFAARAEAETLPHTLPWLKQRRGVRYAYVPIARTSGFKIRAYAKPGCATSANAVFVVVLVTPYPRIAIDVVIGYYDTRTEMYVDCDPAFVTLFGTAHGRYVCDGLPFLPCAPFVTLTPRMSDGAVRRALRDAPAVIVTTHSIRNAGQALALYGRLYDDYVSAHRRLEVFLNARLIWRAVHADDVILGSVPALSGNIFNTFDADRIQDDKELEDNACYEHVGFFEPVTFYT